jgi:hypothetical protein
MEKAFKAGDKVRCIKSQGWYGITEGQEYTVLAVDGRGVRIRGDSGDCNTPMARRFELVEKQQHTITVRYPNGGQGVTLYFDSEQAAREYVRDDGQLDYSYELRAVPAPTVLRVTETTTIVREVSEV